MWHNVEDMWHLFMWLCCCFVIQASCTTITRLVVCIYGPGRRDQNAWSSYPCIESEMKDEEVRRWTARRNFFWVGFRFVDSPPDPEQEMGYSTCTISVVFTSIDSDSEHNDNDDSLSTELQLTTCLARSLFPIVTSVSNWGSPITPHRSSLVLSLSKARSIHCTYTPSVCLSVSDSSILSRLSSLSHHLAAAVVSMSHMRESKVSRPPHAKTHHHPSQCLPSKWLFFTFGSPRPSCHRVQETTC